MKNKILKIFLLFITIISLFSFFCTPVKAEEGNGTYKLVKIQVGALTFSCNLCNENHKVSISELINLGFYKVESGDPDWGKMQPIKCSLCGDKHCILKLTQSHTKQLAYLTAVSANSDITSYKSVLGINTESDAFNLTKILKFDSGSYGSVIDSARTNIYPYISMIANIIILVYFFLDLAEKSLNEGQSYETLLHSGAKTILALLVSANAFDWILLGIEQCNQIFDTLSGGFSKTMDFHIYDGAAECVFTQLINGDTFNAIGTIIYNCLFCVFVFATFITLFIICWARIIDILARIVFAPIGLADFMHGGTNCLAVRYFKRLLASVIQGACIMGVMASYNAIQAAMRGGLSGILTTIIIGFAVIAAVKQTQEIANDIVGV